MRTLHNIYKTYIDIIGFVKTDKRRYEVNNEDENAQMRGNEGVDGMGNEEDENMGQEDED